MHSDDVIDYQINCIFNSPYADYYFEDALIIHRYDGVYE